MMMRKNALLVFLALGISATMNAQVPYKGKVGVNTPTPTENLDVNGTTRLRDLPLNGSINSYYTTGTDTTGTTKANTTPYTPTHVVVTDANGVIGKDPWGLNKILFGVKSSRQPSIPWLGYNNRGAWYPGTYVSSGTYIDLPPGTWRVDVAYIFRIANAYSIAGRENYMLWVRSVFSDTDATTPTNSVSPDVLVSTSNHLISTPILASGYQYVISGYTFIRNTSTATKRYYYVIGNTASYNTGTVPELDLVGDGVGGETRIIATKAEL